MTRVCGDCGRSFEADEDWKTRCLDCFKRMKREQGQREQSTWQDDARRRQGRDPTEGYVRQAHRLVQDAYLAGKHAAEQIAFDRGYDAGYSEALDTKPDLDAELLRAAVALTHPDRHPAERFEAANNVTSRLLELFNAPSKDKPRRAA